MYSVLQERQYHHTYTVIQGYPTHGIYSSALKEQETAAIATIYYQGFFVFALRLTIIITTTTTILMRMISNKDKIKNMNTKEFLIIIYKKKKISNLNISIRILGKKKIKLKESFFVILSNLSILFSFPFSIDYFYPIVKDDYHQPLVVLPQKEKKIILEKKQAMIG